MNGPSNECCPGYLFLCLRVPKTGSQSLEAALGMAFAGTRRFYVPNTLDLDGRLSPMQRLRFLRGQMRNLLAHYRTPSLNRAFRIIDSEAQPGELLCGGHVTFSAVCGSLSKPVKIVTILRNPYDRCRSEYHYARRNHLRKSPLARVDSSVIPRIAAKCDFQGYLDFLLEHREIYGDIGAQYLGIGASDPIGDFFERHVFHAGVLERSAQFARALGEKLGRRVEFPHLNASGSTGQVALDNRAKRAIERLYERDFAIYEYLLAEAGGSHRRPSRTERTWPAAQAARAGHVDSRLNGGG
jgi:hypothetical protein